MILGFFGKGGSGKTTTSFRCIQSIEAISKHVLAVDADHNMDLTYNFGLREPVSCLGSDVTAGYVFTDDTTRTLSSYDEVNQRYLHSVSERISLLIAGPHTEPIFQGELCSHGLLKPINSYLSQINLQEGEHIIVDATAGMDSIGAGLPAYLQVGIVCVEPTVHSIKVGRQLVEGLSRLRVPSLIVANKIQTDQQKGEVAASFFGKKILPISFRAELLDPRAHLSEADRGMYRAIFEAAVREYELRDVPSSAS